MSDVAKLLTVIGSSCKKGHLTTAQHDQLCTLASNKDPNAVRLIQHVDDPVEKFAETAISVLNQVNSANGTEEKKLAPSGGSFRNKPRVALDIDAVKEANQTREALEADEEESESDARLKEKRMGGGKRRTMPEKLQIDQSKLKSEAAPAK